MKKIIFVHKIGLPSAVILLSLLWVAYAQAKSAESLNNPKGETGTTLGVLIEGEDTNFNESSKMEVLPKDDISVKSIGVESSTKIVATIEIDSGADIGPRSLLITSPIGENQPEERVVVLNAFTVIPSTRYQIFQNNRLIKSFLDPDVEVVLKHTESVNIEIEVFPESGKSEKRNSPSHADEDDSFHTYNLGTFNAGDRIEITISKEGQKKEILVPRRVLKVRPYEFFT